MDQNLELLNYIYQNTKTGEESIQTLLNSIDDSHLKQDLITQMEGYASLNQKARKAIYQNNKEPKQPGILNKAMIHTSIKMNTLKDKSNSHIAEMMIQGSTMGIIEATEKLNQYETAEKNVRNLADQVVSFEQKNIERLKGYL